MKLEYRLMLPDEWLWFTNHLPVFAVEDSQGVMVLSGDKPVASWVFDSYTGASVQAHLLVLNTMCLKYGIIESMAGAAYESLGVDMIIASVPSDKPAAVKMNKHIGFEEVATIPNALGKGVDSIVMSMTKDQCKYYSPMEVAANG